MERKKIVFAFVSALGIIFSCLLFTPQLSAEEEKSSWYDSFLKSLQGAKVGAESAASWGILGRTTWKKEAGSFTVQLAPLAIASASSLNASCSATVSFATAAVTRAREVIGDYDRIHLQGTQEFDLVPGAPVLPVKSVTLLIPYGQEVTKVKVIPDKAQELPGKYLLAPAQEPVPISLAGRAKVTRPNTAIYNSNQVYPPVPCDINLQKKNGYTLLQVNLIPVVYAPASRKVSFYPKMRIEVETANQTALQATGLTRGEIPPAQDPQTQAEIRQLISNPQALETYAPATFAAVANARSLALPQGGPYAYVIITSEALKSGFGPLIDEKKSKGLTAGIVTTEYISANYTGLEPVDTKQDKADKIRAFIKDAYQNWNTRWVLLGGDVEVVPARGVYVKVGKYTENALPTDLYYACLDGPWDYDGDDLWGESNDGANGGEIDLVPEVYVGRASASNLQEVANFVTKTVAYETQAHPHAKKAIWLAEKLSDTTQGSYSKIPIKNQCLDSTWDITERYDENGAWKAADFIADLNASPHIVNHLGHAAQTYNARIANKDVVNLTNTSPYFMLSQGCLSGSFDTHDRCIAEEHTVGTSHGAVGVIMNARYGWYQPGTTPSCSHFFDLAFWDAVLKQKKLHFAEANEASRLANLSRVGPSDRSVYRWIYLEVNLLGDPETSFYQPQAPQAPSNLFAIASSATDIKLTWKDNSNDEDGFKLERSFNGGDFQPLLQLGANVITYTDQNLAFGTYAYRIKAFNAIGESAYSSTATTKITGVSNVNPLDYVIHEGRPINVTTAYMSIKGIDDLNLAGLYFTASSSDPRQVQVWYQPQRNILIMNAGGGQGVPGTNKILESPYAKLDCSKTAVVRSDSTLTVTWNFTFKPQFYGIKPEVYATAQDKSNAVRSSPRKGLWTIIAEPAAPGNLVATAASSSQINLSWKDMSDFEEGFRVERSTDGTNFTPLKTLDPNTTSYSDIGLAANTKYYYRLLAFVVIGGGPRGNFSNVASATTSPNPKDGLLARATAIPAQGKVGQPIRFSAAGSQGDIIGYEWQFSDGLRGTGPEFIRPFYWPGGYWVLLTIADRNGREATARAGVNIVPAGQNPPTAPSSLVATAVSAKQINLSWQDNSSNETNFILERSANDNSHFQQIAIPVANAITYSDTNLDLSICRYYYRLKAHNQGGDSAYSNLASVTIATTPPQAPTNLMAMVVSSRIINLAWKDNSTNETGFRLERSLNAASGFQQITQTLANVTSYSDTNLSSNTAYYYRVRAINCAGNSGDSNTVSAKTFPSADLVAKAQAVPLIGRMGQPIRFSAAGSTGEIVGYVWLFSDGQRGMGREFTRAFYRPGIYFVTLTIADRNGREATAHTGVMITP